MSKLFTENEQKWEELCQRSIKLVSQAASVRIAEEAANSYRECEAVVGAYRTAGNKISNGNYDTLTIHPPIKLSSAGPSASILVKVDFLQPRQVNEGGYPYPEISGTYYIKFKCTHTADGWEFFDAELDREEHAPGSMW